MHTCLFDPPDGDNLKISYEETTGRRQIYTFDLTAADWADKQELSFSINHMENDRAIVWMAPNLRVSSIPIGNQSINDYLFSLAPDDAYRSSDSASLYHLIFNDLTKYEEICAYFNQQTDVFDEVWGEIKFSTAMEAKLVRVEVAPYPEDSPERMDYAVELFYGNKSMKMYKYAFYC